MEPDQLRLEGIESKPERLDPNGPLVDIKAAAKLAGMSQWAYRRNLLINKAHPKPVTVGRPMLFRRVDIVAWLGADQA